MTELPFEPNRYDLYEWAVQAPAMQVRFLEAVHGGAPEVLGEDFSGPASLGRAWVALGPEHRAVCVDRDPEPLVHARARAGALSEDAGLRLDLRSADVLEVDDPADVIAALNFCVGEWHDRAACLAYLRHVRGRLRPGGVFVADLYGGVGAFLPGEYHETKATPIGEVAYVWDQQRTNPLTARVQNAIHFALPSGKTLSDAFRYDWRLWGLAELRDALSEAGFAAVEVYTNEADVVDDDGRVVVAPLRDADGQDELAEDWIVYVVGRVAG